jgi:hypothetical protein
VKSVYSAVQSAQGERRGSAINFQDRHTAVVMAECSLSLLVKIFLTNKEAMDQYGSWALKTGIIIRE